MSTSGGADTNGSLDEIVLEVPAELSSKAVVTLVAGGVASRHGFPIDRIDDLQIALSSVLAYNAERVVRFAFTVDSNDLRVRIGPLTLTVGRAETGLRRLAGPLTGNPPEITRDGDHAWLSLHVATA